MAKRHEKVDRGSGDVFADLGFQDAGEHKLRTQLAMRLNDLIAANRLTQARAAALFGIPQPHVSELKNYKLSRFSSERLLRFLTQLDRDVEIVIRAKAKGRSAGHLKVAQALGLRFRPGEMPPKSEVPVREPLADGHYAHRSRQMAHRPRLTPYQAAVKVGLLGCMEGPADLALNHRKYARKVIRAKYRRAKRAA